MEGILEIRDTCKTPIELLTSDAFEKYLNTYKRLFIKQFRGPNIIDCFIIKSKPTTP